MAYQTQQTTVYRTSVVYTNQQSHYVSFTPKEKPITLDYTTGRVKLYLFNIAKSLYSQYARGSPHHKESSCYDFKGSCYLISIDGRRLDGVALMIEYCEKKGNEKYMPPKP